MFVGNQNPGLENNRRMHAVLDEMKIPYDYREFDGIAHNLKLLADQVQDGNFAFAARSFKLPQFGRHKAFVNTGVGADDQSSSGVTPPLHRSKSNLLS
jgi:hypothetical protein